MFVPMLVTIRYCKVTIKSLLLNRLYSDLMVIGVSLKRANTCDKNSTSDQFTNLGGNMD